MPNRILYWFRHDLRLHDNEGFARAVKEAQEVIPVFIFNPKLFRELPQLGMRKTGIYRAQFLLEAVTDLRQSLQAKGADLLIRIGDPARILSDLAEDNHCTAVYTSKEVTQEETDDESSLSKRLKPLNIDLELVWESTLYHVRDLPFGISKLPDIFTQFRNKIEHSVAVRGLIPTPETVTMAPGVDAGELPTLHTFGFDDESISTVEQPDPRRAVPFKGGETVGLQRLNAYIWQRELVKTYKETRNGLLGEDYSSKFSAWLSAGCLSPRLIYHEVKRYETERVGNDPVALQSTYWLIFELIWRDFFRFVALRYGTRIFKPSGIMHDTRKKGIRDQALFLKWAEGKTGIPFIDANMREMNATGFMSNRGRQNVGSFLVNDLGIDWTLGAAYFESLLIDYDPCSNWGNWNYIAGVGNDPRSDGNGQARYFNIFSQATRYDEQGAYVKHWLPELVNVPAEKVHVVSELTQAEQKQYDVVLGEDYPIPIVNPTKWLKKS